MPLTAHAREVCPDDGLIFPKFARRYPLREAARTAGLEPDRASKVKPYDFRHSIATELTERSGNLLGIGYLLGHRHATTTNQYVHARRRVDEDCLARLDAVARQTSYSRAEVLRRCLVGAPLRSTVDAQALTEVARVHADLNRISGLLKLAIREGVSDRSSYRRLNLELIDSVLDVRRAVKRLAGRR